MSTKQNSPDTSELGAEILMVLTSLIILIILLCQIIQLVISLTIRIRKRKRIISVEAAKLFVSSAYDLSLPLMSYLFSQAKKCTVNRANVIIIWMVLIEIIRLGNSHYSTWKLWKSLENLVRLVWVGYLVYSYAHRYEIRVILFVLCIYSAFLEVVGIGLHLFTKYSHLIGNNPILINNYMNKIMLQDDLRSTPMHSCDYIVMGEENHEIAVCSNGYNLGKKKPYSQGVLTIGRVFQLNSSEDKAFTLAYPNWRDNCLSLALAKMLRRRFAKVPVNEAGCRKALDFVLEGIIDYIGRNGDIQTDGNDGERNPTERVYSIIEEELKLVSNFFTMVLVIYDFTRVHYLVNTIRFIFMVVFGYYLFSYAISILYIWRGGFHRSYSSASASVSGSGSLDANCQQHFLVMGAFRRLDEAITLLLVFACIYIQCQGIARLIASKHWFNFIIVKRFIKDPAKWNRSYSSLGVSKSRKRLSRLVQRENLKETRVYYSSVFDLEAETIFLCIKVDMPFLARLPNWIRKIIPRSSPTVVHSTDVKEAILESLRKSCGRLTNGKTSLRKYGMERFNWACQPNDSTTEAILVWHIATTLFHHLEFSPHQNNDHNQEPPPQQNNNPFEKAQVVALGLSSYCCYLVEYHPELLPDDVQWTQGMYERVTQEILTTPWSCDQKPTRKDRCNYVLHAMWVESSVVGKGVMLAKDLLNCADRAEVWTMLADFWAEMMLFITPSDNVEAHEKIIERGELITQLWALLTHAGIVTRPKPTNAKHSDHESESNVVTGDTNV